MRSRTPSGRPALKVAHGSREYWSAEYSVGEYSVGEYSVGEYSVGENSVGEYSVGEVNGRAVLGRRVLRGRELAGVKTFALRSGFQFVGSHEDGLYCDVLKTSDRRLGALLV